MKKSKKKIFQTRESLLKQMIPSEEELNFRKQKLIQSKTDKLPEEFKCTKCDFNFDNIIVKHHKVFTHPLMDVLLCRKCCNYYGDGDFSLDSDDEDKYCRWCGEGGTLFTCSKCICGFCCNCIKKHFGLTTYKKIQKEDDWLCYFCDPRPLWDLRFICDQAKEKCKSIADESNKEQPNFSSPQRKRNSKDFKKLANNRKCRFRQECLTIDSSTSDISDFESERQISPMKRNLRQRHCASSKFLQLGKRENTRKSNLKRRHSSSSEYSSTSKKFSKKKKRSSSVSSIEEYDDDDDDDDNDDGDGDDDYDYDYNHEEDDNDDVDNDNDKSNNVSPFQSTHYSLTQKLENIVKLAQHQMTFGVKWSEKKLINLSHSRITSPHQVVKECQKIKWFLSSLASYLVGFSNSIDMIERSHSSTESVSASTPSLKSGSYNEILQFLEFITNQVKTFQEKGLNFKDIIQAEIYDDNNMIGLKKKPEPGVKTIIDEINKENPKNESVSREEPVKIYDEENFKDLTEDVTPKKKDAEETKDHDDTECESLNKEEGEDEKSNESNLSSNNKDEKTENDLEDSEVKDDILEDIKKVEEDYDTILNILTEP